MESKRGQVTIFIIIALIIVFILIIVFLGNNDFRSAFISKTPVEEVENCIQSSIVEGVEIIGKQGGTITPENYFMYKGNKIEYACYTEESFKACIVQKPILKNTVEQELKEFSDQRIKECLDSLKEGLERKGYEVSMKEPNVSIELVPNNILVNMDIDLSITRDGTENFKSIRAAIDSNIYNSVLIASSIVNWETRYGDSETLNYMLYYPSLKVEKKKQGDGTTVYILTDRDTNEKFYFATRSYVIPPGGFEIIR